MKAIKAYESWNNEEVKEVVFWRASRWISIKSNYNPNRRNGLWDYVTDGRGYSVNYEKVHLDEFYTTPDLREWARRYSKSV